MKSNITTFVCAIAAAMIVACAPSVIANSGPTLAQFDALVAKVASIELAQTSLAADLNTAKASLGAAETGLAAAIARLDTIESAALGGQVYVQPAAGGGMAKLSFAAVEGGLPLGTYVGADTPKLSIAATLRLSSSSGYYFEVPTDPGPIGAAPTYLGETLFEGPGCSGKAYLREDIALTAYGARQGVVTRHEPSVAGPYLMVVKDTTRQQVDFLSRKLGPTTCIDAPGSFVGYALIENDPLVTGVENTPVGTGLKLGPKG